MKKTHYLYTSFDKIIFGENFFFFYLYQLYDLLPTSVKFIKSTPSNRYSSIRVINNA